MMFYCRFLFYCLMFFGGLTQGLYGVSDKLVDKIRLFDNLYAIEPGLLSAPVAEPPGGFFVRFQVFVLHNMDCVNGYRLSYDGSDPTYHGYWASGSRIYWQGITKSQTIRVVCLDYNMQPSAMGVYRFVLNGLDKIPAVKLRTGLFSGPQPVNMNYAEAVEVPVEVDNFAVLSSYGEIKTEYMVTGFDTVMKGRVKDKFKIWVAGVANCQPPRHQVVKYRSLMARFVYEYKVKYTKELQYEPINNYAGYHYQELVCE